MLEVMLIVTLENSVVDTCLWEQIELDRDVEWVDRQIS